MPKQYERIIDIDERGRIADAYERELLKMYFTLYASGKMRIRLSKPKRSSRANRYYFGVVIETIRRARLEAGMEPVSAEDLHRHFKMLYLPVRTVEIMGVDHTFEGSSKDLDSTAFFDFVENIRNDEDVRRLMLETGLTIEDPVDWQEHEGAFRSHQIAEMA